jgi:hypothetical protein
MIPLCGTPQISLVTLLTERGVFIWDTEEKFHQNIFFAGFNSMGGVAGGTLHGTISVKGKGFRYTHTV